jgi:hypothetical protein
LLLAEAVESLAYHLALCRWPDEIITIRPWLRRTVERWPLPETGGTLGRLCRRLGLPLWERPWVWTARDIELMGKRVDDVLQGVLDVNEVWLVGAQAARDRIVLMFHLVSMIGAAEQLRLTCCQPEWEARWEASAKHAGWAPAESRIPVRSPGRPARRIWPVLHEIEPWLRERHRNWRRELDGGMPWKLLARHLVYLGCGDDVARSADSLRHGLARWRIREGLVASHPASRSQTRCPDTP